MSTTTAPSGTARTASALRRLYFVRAAFALVWAAVTIAAADGINPLAVALFVLYPLFDAGAAVHDLRSSRDGGSPALLRVNIAVSLVAAAGLGATAASGVPAMLRVWGLWAIVAGLVQLVVGVTRRGLGGQWPMIISGGLSVLAGGSFVAMAGAADPSLASAAGYAVPGAVFFLVSAVRLGQATTGQATTGQATTGQATTGRATNGN
ncbi:hypothetical protein [Actinoplanes sp. DH11]|uniref:hypothetical protein n=1 Tax=Actinoplanes sp. DH11 TaxID=2857011 RepID=UPI001E5B0285|nr:hypothetical protein [Actinoplanes sp. DH11]